MKPWGCPAYVKVVKTGKLDAKSEKGRFIGYPKDSLGYYFYFHADTRVLISRHAKFLENEFIEDGGVGRKFELSEESGKLDDDQPQMDEPVDADERVHTDEPFRSDAQTSVDRTLRRSSRISRSPKRYYFLSENDFESFMIGEDIQKEDLRSYEEAILDIDSGRWLEAMKSEMESMYANQVWSIVDPPEGIVPIGCKWVYKRKYGKDGKVETYKARLVAKGYNQRQGVDFDETFSPVAMLKSIRILLAIAAYYDYEIWQMDVRTAFLNGFIEETIYMQQPVGYVTSGDSHKVCKLHRSIYGLKQASRSWNIRFDDAVKSFGFIKNIDEPCVYRKKNNNAITFLVLYVDDILLIGNDVGMLSEAKLWLSNVFSMKDMGEATFILGIRVYIDRAK